MSKPIEEIRKELYERHSDANKREMLVRDLRERHKKDLKPEDRNTQEDQEEAPEEYPKSSDYFQDYLEKDEKLANKIRIVNRILWLLSYHFSAEKVDKSKGEKKLLEYLGFDVDYLVKMLAAIFKELGNTTADEPREIIALARKIGEAKNEEEEWTAGSILCEKILGFSEQPLKTKSARKEAKTQVREKLEAFNALLSHFNDLLSYPEWGPLKKVLEDASENPSQKLTDFARTRGIVERDSDSIRFDENVLAELTGQPVAPAQREPARPAPMREAGPDPDAIRANPDLKIFVTAIEQAARAIRVPNEDYERDYKAAVGEKNDVIKLINLHSEGRLLGTWLVINKEEDPLKTLTGVYEAKSTAELEREIRLLGAKLNQKYPGLATLTL